MLINVRKGKVAIRVRGKLDLIRLVQRRACNLSRNCFEHERKALCVLVDVLVQGKLGPGQLGPGQLGPGQLGPGQLGPGAQLSGAQLSGAQLSGAQLSGAQNA